jgi:hypothetical protein
VVRSHPYPCRRLLAWRRCRPSRRRVLPGWALPCSARPQSLAPADAPGNRDPPHRPSVSGLCDHRSTSTPIAGRQEITREEKATERLRGEYAEKPRCLARSVALARRSARSRRAADPPAFRHLPAAHVGADAGGAARGSRARCSGGERDGRRAVVRVRVTRRRRRSCFSPHGRAGRIRPTTTAANSTRRTVTSPTCCLLRDTRAIVGPRGGSLRWQPRQPGRSQRECRRLAPTRGADRHDRRRQVGLR